MDYNYESLLDERFQMLCQAILLRTYPDLQCLPVGMPDGGRDAISPGLGKDIVIFQVKFTRDPRNIVDTYDWLAKTVAQELPKINHLRDRGATRYILMTNVIGTSHLDTGGIDKVQAYLNTLPLPSQCWWRSDLDRRLDVNYDLKLHYPTVMSGPDIVRLMWETACAGEGKDRRRTALRAYFKHQSTLDSTIRFKQAELLPTPLFELFVDVPIASPTAGQRSARLTRKTLDEIIPILVRTSMRRDRNRYRYIGRMGFADEPNKIWVEDQDGRMFPLEIGAAELLLTPDFGKRALGIVLEGAPGQGKSTLAQFLAQVNRVRILNDDMNLSGLPSFYSESPLSLPFKLELRDIGAWIKGIDPWSTDQESQHTKPKTLEGAIAGHIERYSGGISFDVADLHLAFASSPVMLILDALDEVADLDDRKRVIEEVQLAVGRLQTSCQDLKLIITSRPSAIAGAPIFPLSQFITLTLGAIDHRLALDYTARWAIARRLDEKDTNEIRQILTTKMNSPHMAELAKNTMQLSILLSLIHLRGSSLPDKRTELYDTYVEVFLNRESEKSKIVRENRELLIDIHRFLGYYIHARAEASGATGRISLDELKEVVTGYLAREGRSISRLEELLTGIVDRFGALVSRVEGTWEFEVQPLREYFAARHLYDTAPYSPPGRISSGTKPDRFDGIAGNPYWLNVTRFFAGCFSKGELLDLADRLSMLISDSREFSTYGRMLAVYLLQDWVFTQSPRATWQVVENVFDHFGLRWASSAFSSASHFYNQTGIPEVELSSGAGAEELVNLTWAILKEQNVKGIRSEVCGLAQHQGGGSHVRRIWLDAVRSHDDTEASREFLLNMGWHFNTLRELPQELLSGLIGSDESTIDDRLALALRSGAPVEYLPYGLLDRAIRALVDRPGYPLGPFKEPLSIFTYFTAPETWSMFAYRDVDDWSRIFQRAFSKESKTPLPLLESSETVQSVAGVNAVNSHLYTELIVHEQRGLAAWRTVTRVLHENFENSWVELELGAMSASSTLGSDRTEPHPHLFDTSASVIDRVRAARRRASHASWWRTERSKASTIKEHCFWVLVAYAWASPRVLGQLLEDVGDSVAKLPASWRTILFRACHRSGRYSPHSRKPLHPGDSSRALNCKDDFVIALLFERLAKDDKRHIVDGDVTYLLKSRDTASVVLDFVVSQVLAGERELVADMNLIGECFHAGANSASQIMTMTDTKLRALGEEFSDTVLRNAWNMPSDFVIVATLMHNSTRSRVESVESIAERERWFADE